MPSTRASCRSLTIGPRCTSSRYGSPEPEALAAFADERLDVRVGDARGGRCAGRPRSRPGPGTGTTRSAPAERRRRDRRRRARRTRCCRRARATTFLSSVPASCADTPARGRRSGERHERHVGIGDDRLAGVGAAARRSAGRHRAGRPPRTRRRTSRRPRPGVCGSGFRTTALPSARAGATTRIPSTVGKFHGVIAPTTPTGTRRTIERRPRCAVGMSEPYGWEGIVAAFSTSWRRSSARGASCRGRRRSPASVQVPNSSAVRLVDLGGAAQDARPLLVAGLGPRGLGRVRPRGGARDVVGRRPAGACSRGRPEAGSLISRGCRSRVASRPGTGPASRRSWWMRPSRLLLLAAGGGARDGRAAGGRVTPDRPARQHLVDEALLQKYGGTFHEYSVLASWPG